MHCGADKETGHAFSSPRMLPEIGRFRLVAGLPVVDTWDEFAAVCADEAVLRPGVDHLCRLLDLDTASLVRFTRGSVPVYAAGNLVLKLFPPVNVAGCHVEAGVLTALNGTLPTPTPRVHAVGEHDGWGYVLMSRLPGVPLESVWDRATGAERDRLAAQLGETLAALHEAQPPVIDQWWPGDWSVFVAGQRAQCVAEQQGRGLAPAWAAQIPGFLDGVELAPGPPVLLHTEVMREHLLVTQQSGSWRLSGLFDFEPAMRGAREYEFAAVGVFVSQGDARFLRRALTAYGYSSDELDHELRRRLLAWAILHRYSNLASYLRRLPAPDRPTLDALADRWFGTDQDGS